MDRTSQRTRSPRTLVGVIAATALIVAACSSGGATASPSAAAPASAPASAAPASAGTGGTAARIIDFGFDPASLTATVGATVTWTNTGAAPHTVTADDNSFDSKNLAPGATFSQTFATAGTFAYHCAIHPAMKATVTVQ